MSYDNSGLLSVPDLKNEEDPTDVVQVAATIQELLGIQSPSFPAILDLIAELPFEASMSYLSVLAAGLYHARRDTRLHLRLAYEVFGDGPMIDQTRRFLANGASRIVFDERYLIVLQRLLVEHAGNDQTRHLTRAQHASLLTCLFGLGDALDEREPPAPDEDGDYDVPAWTTYTIQRGAYYNTPDMLEGIVRTTTMLTEIASEQDLLKHHAHCPLESWSRQDANGASPADQLAYGLALITALKILDPSLRLADRPTSLEPGYMADSAFADREAQISDAVSATREDLRAMYTRAGSTPAHIAWDHAPFEQRPLLRRADESLILISPTAIESWMGRGLYFRMLDSARSRQRAGDFTTFMGALAERYVLRLVSRSHDPEFPVVAAEVSGDRPYRIGKRELRTPDIVLAQPPDLVLMEVYSGRIPRAARISGNLDAIEAALDKLILKKLTELNNRIGDLLTGQMPLPGVTDLHGLRVWPMLVLTGDHIFQLPMLWRWVRERLPEGVFGDARVQPPAICNLDDLEPLLALVERGESLPELLSAFHGSQLAQFPPRNWIAATHSLPLSERPAYVQTRYKAVMNGSHRLLFP